MRYGECPPHLVNSLWEVGECLREVPDISLEVFWRDSGAVEAVKQPEVLVQNQLAAFSDEHAIPGHFA